MNPHSFGGALVLLAALVGSSATERGRQLSPLECRLVAERKHSPGGPVMVTFILRNTTSSAVSVLDWQTPLEGLLGDIFSIVPKAGGEPLPYQGPMVKRGDPEPDEYVRIEPHGEASGSVDAAAAYDLSRPGRYVLSFRGPILDLAPREGSPRRREDLRPVRVDCAAVELEITP